MSSSPAPSSGSPWVGLSFHSNHTICNANSHPFLSLTLQLQNEYTNAEGRTYWSHSVTKQSVWDKPDDLKTPFEVSEVIELGTCLFIDGVVVVVTHVMSQQAMSNTVWKQYISKGRAYYVNSKTKETLVC